MVPPLGEWHSYHWSRAGNGKPVFRHEKWVFRLSWRGLTIATADEAREGFCYRGTVEFTGDDVVLTFTGKSHDELAHIRLNKPIPHEDTLMVGVFMVEDFDGVLCAGITTACRTRRFEEDAKAELGNFCQFDAAEQATAILIYNTY